MDTLSHALFLSGFEREVIPMINNYYSNSWHSQVPLFCHPLSNEQKTKKQKTCTVVFITDLLFRIIHLSFSLIFIMI